MIPDDKNLDRQLSLNNVSLIYAGNAVSSSVLQTVLSENELQLTLYLLTLAEKVIIIQLFLEVSLL